MTKVEILSGARTIGSNFIKITDRDSSIIFDQGIRLDTFGKYFDHWTQPSGIMELRELNVLPKQDWYSGATDLYVTHLHLDHLGALSNVPAEINVHLPGLPIYSEMKKKWANSPSWLNLIPENYYLKPDEILPLSEDKKRVMAVPVSHSAFPAFALIFFGTEKTILYSGDMRVHSFLETKEFKSINKGPDLLEFLESQHDIKVDLLLLEGTNFGSQRTPFSPDAALSLEEKILSVSDLVIVTSHQLDAEFLLSTINMAKRLGFSVYLSSEIAGRVIQKSGIRADIKILEEFSETPMFPTAPLSGASKDKSLIISSYYEIIDLCRRLDEQFLRSRRVVCILTEPEPISEEMLDYGTVNRWLSRYGIQVYRIRVSGHYYPFEIGEILGRVKAKEVVPIHTEHPELMLRMAQPFMARDGNQTHATHEIGSTAKQKRTTSKKSTPQ